MPDSFYFGLTICALLLLVGHWLPWPSHLPQILAYAYGQMCILIGIGIWLLGTGQIGVWRNICAFVLVAGVVVVAAYAYDLWRHHQVQEIIDRSINENERDD